MSRQVDLTQPLSDEDRQYLLDRNRHADVKGNDALFGDEETKRAALQGVQVIDEGNTGDMDPFTRDDGSDVAAYTQHGQRALTPAQIQRAKAMESGEDDGTYDVEGQTELQESMVGGPPRVLNADGTEVPQPDTEDVSTHTEEPEAREGDDGSAGGADLREEATQNALAQGDSDALEKAQELPGSTRSDNYDSLSKEELRVEAERRGLTVSGTIPELKARLRANDKS